MTLSQQKKLRYVILCLALLIVCAVFVVIGLPGRLSLSGSQDEKNLEREQANSSSPKKGLSHSASVFSPGKEIGARLEDRESAKWDYTVTSKALMDRILDNKSLEGLKLDEITQGIEGLRANREDWLAHQGEVYQAWGRGSPKEALAYARENEGSSSTGLMNQALIGWAGIAPQEAQGWILAHATGRERFIFVNTLLPSLEKEDQLELVLSESADDSHQGRVLLSGFVKKWSAKEPAEKEFMVKRFEQMGIDLGE